MDREKGEKAKKIMNRGNVDKVMDDAADIVRRLRQTNATLTGLMKEYHCTHYVLMQAIRSQMSKAQWKRLSKKKMALAGIKTRFKKGHKTFNKGMKGIHLSPATEFRKGHLPSTHRHVGSIRINTRTRKGNTVSFKEIKISGIMQGSHKWIPYARYIWQQNNGEVPKGHFIVHDNGDTFNDEPDNLKCVNRRGHLALQMKRDPGMLKKCRKAVGKAATKRHARNRRLKNKKQVAAEKKKAQTEKEAGKKLIKMQKQKEANLRDKAIIDSGITDLRGVLAAWWECMGCGFESNTIRPPLPCPKCSGLNFERISQRTKGLQQAECDLQQAV